MEKMLEEDVWLAGYPLWVHWHLVILKSSINTNGGTQVEEDSAESKKKKFVDFKRVVWHKAFYEIVESIEKYAKLGYVLVCGDGVRRKIYPAILIVSADYEEQCVIVAFITAHEPC